MNYENVANSEFAKIAGVTRRTIERAFKTLQKKKIIERMGSKRDGYWLIVK